MFLLSTAVANAEAPSPPRFPFESNEARKHQGDYAAWRKLPTTVANRSEMTFVLVPPGTFQMGSPETEPGHKGDERLHAVTISTGYYLGQHEVTVGQFAAFVKAADYKTDIEKNGGGHAHSPEAVWEHHPGTSWRKPGYFLPVKQEDNHPVVHVSHTDAVAYCKWLTEVDTELKGVGKVKYVLPSEAQWEWACRAGSNKRFWWGDDEDTSGKVANVGDQSMKDANPRWPRKIMAMNDGAPFVRAVGSYQANAFGMHDMLGNVWEFCGSRHGAYPKEPTIDPGDLGTQESYSVRGGGWSNEPADCRCAARNSDPPHFGHSNLGFRVLAVRVE
jgi:formylglycine-generating enzyme required for sulfatase activity